MSHSNNRSHDACLHEFLAIDVTLVNVSAERSSVLIECCCWRASEILQYEQYLIPDDFNRHCLSFKSQIALREGSLSLRFIAESLDFEFAT